MFCPKCGQNLPEGAIFCPSCGFNISQSFNADQTFESTYAAPQVSPLDKAKKTLSSPLFLAIAILLSISFVLKFYLATIDIILLPIVIGVWMAYAGATGEKTKLIGSGISLTSIAVKIQSVLIYILAGFILVVGIIFFIAFASIGETAGDFIYDTFDQITSSSIVEGEYTDSLELIFPLFGKISGTMIGGIIFVISLIFSGIFIVLNVLFIGRFSKFLTTAKRAYKEDQPIDLNDHRCATWIFVYGIIVALGAVSSLLSTFNLIALTVNGCTAAACIIASKIMKNEIE